MMLTVKKKYKVITTSQGQSDNRCPACSGECVDYDDFTNANGGHINIKPCELCNGSGRAVEGKDYKLISFLDQDERQQIYIETMEGKPYMKGDN